MKFLCDSCNRKESYQSARGNQFQGFRCAASGKMLKFLALKKKCKSYRKKEAEKEELKQK